MTDLRAKPYFLDDEGIAWVENTIASMSAEEKVGQLFFQLMASQDEAYLKDLMERFHLGGCRYNNMPSAMVQNQNRILQQYAKVPVFIACNTESGGDGAAADGTHIGAGIKIGATGKNEYARALGKYANAEAAAIGCNMAFAPVCDIHYNWLNTEVVTRAFGNDPGRVAAMSLAYMEGAHENGGFACAAKHFPGNGLDHRDAHMANNINGMSVEEWDATYGMVYRTLIDGGLDAIMGGHIMLPEYARAINPAITPDEMMPATLSYDIMTTLLRDKLGFNGMVVTDASHMVAMTDRMTRREMLPAAINAGCDMFLFFNDPDEDFATMLEAYTTGRISEERMTEALTRILGLKAKMGLHKKAKADLVPAPEVLASEIGKQEYRDVHAAIARDAVTLVKYKDEGVLPLTPEKYKRIMIVHVKGPDSPFMALAAMAMGGGMNRKTPAEDLRDRLIEKGFDAFIYESPLEKMKKMIAAGEKPSLNLYFAGKNAIADFTSQQDLVITLCDVMSGRPVFGMSKGGGEIPWYVFELPVVGISVNAPTMLADVPQFRTYINAYDSKPATMEALVDALVAGPDAFKGKDPIDSFCGLWDARL
ncbi:MAG: beta-hexosaminidase [Oscillospiraceae bacterium]|nr:beta-hexosaminidase [Oscillospiraceae bacterium]